MAHKSGLPNGSKCRDQFPFNRELDQKRKLVYRFLVRSVIRCFLGSGVLDLRTPIVP